MSLCSLLERPRRMRHAKHNTTDRNEENTHSNTLTHTQTQPSPSFPTRQRSEGVSYRPGFKIIQGDETCVPCAARGAAILSNACDRTTRQFWAQNTPITVCPGYFFSFVSAYPGPDFGLGDPSNISGNTGDTRRGRDRRPSLSLRPTESRVRQPPKTKPLRRPAGRLRSCECVSM
jgi:hypothetical protein